MANPSCLQYRRGRAYFRLRVPDELRNIIGKREIVRALQARDGRSAAAEVRRLRAEYDRRFEEARGQAPVAPTVTPAATPVAPDVELTDLIEIAFAWFDCQERTALLTPAQMEPGTECKVFGQLIQRRATLAGSLFGEQAAELRAEAGRLAQAHWPGIVLPETSHTALVELLRRARLESVQRSLARLEGNYAATFDRLFAGRCPWLDAAERKGATTMLAEPPPAVAATAAITLGELIARFRAEPNHGHFSPKTELRHRRVFEVLEELLDRNRPAAAIGRAEARRVRDLLAALPPNATKRFPARPLTEIAALACKDALPVCHINTVNSLMAVFSCLMGWAEREGYLDKNPCVGLQLKAATRAKPSRRPFTRRELEAIFSTSHYARTDPRAKPGRFWIPLLGLFTGARLNELCQLGAADAVDEDGVLCLRIAADADQGQRLKTANAERMIPVHQALLDLGFADYVARRRRGGRGELLFADVTRGGTGYFSDPFSKWFARHLQQAGIKEPAICFHSFRHSFRDALRTADVGEEKARAICGWSDANLSSHYGQGFSPAALKAEIDRVTYPDLDLSRLIAATGEAERALGPSGRRRERSSPRT